MTAIRIDGNFHEVKSSVATALTAGASGTSAVGTISATTAAGAAATVTVTDCTDYRGSFLLNPVTGGGSQTAGKVALVRFARPYSSTPASVQLVLMNETDTTATIVGSSANVTVDGFDVVVGTALTTAKAYRVNYVVCT